MLTSGQFIWYAKPPPRNAGAASIWTVYPNNILEFIVSVTTTDQSMFTDTVTQETIN